MGDDQVVARVSEPMPAVACFFGGSAFDALKPRLRRDYDAVKVAVLSDGGFSAFDATSTEGLARIFDSLMDDPDVVIDTAPAYPWVGVRARVHD